MLHSIARRSRLSPVRTVDSLVAAFDEGWERSDGSLAEFWSRWRDQRPIGDLSALIKVDLRRRFERGERPAASTYLAQFPELSEDGDRVLSLVYEEFCLLDEYQADPSVADFCRRYERWKDSIASQLGYHRRFSQVAAAVRPEVCYPAVGEVFASYRLCSELGRGGTARVYRATDDDLGGREVVLKLTPTLGLEPSILASLEHRNIVPIHSVARPEGSTLQGICMPYRPGITLERLLIQLLASGPPRRARIIWDLLGLDHLDRDQADLAWRDFPIRGTYTEGVAWLGLEMAQALAYLHGRGVFHRDVKPANILLSTRGGPLLIDFNLAHSPHTPEQARAAMSGGTLPYMAPEQLQAFLDPDTWPHVGPKADIYALGLVLRELVTGVMPTLPTAGLPLDRAIADLRDRRPEYAASSRDRRPDLPPSLDAIIRKCLAFDPADRYASAQELGDDLRLFLERKPLAGATNPSPVERGLNWVYRQRRAAFSLLLMGVFLACGFLINLDRPRPEAARPAPTRPIVRVARPTGASASRPADPLLREPPPIRPRRSDARKIFDAHDPAFLDAIEILRTKPNQEWDQAKEGLTKLAQQHPDSAWPLVYLVQIERKTEIRNKLMKELLEKSDVEAASLHCLDWAPNKNPLLLTLGIKAFARGEYDQARLYYEKASQNQPGVKFQLARLAKIQGRLDDAIALFAEEINLLESAKKPVTFEDRKNLIQLILGQLDATLDVPGGPEVKEKAEHLDKLASYHLDALKRELSPLSKAEADFPYLLDLDRGRLASSRAYLAALNLDGERSVAGFKAARDDFDRAWSAAKKLPETRDGSPNIPSRDEILAYIRALRGQADRRIAECGLTNVLDPPIPSPPG